MLLGQLIRGLIDGVSVAGHPTLYSHSPLHRQPSHTQLVTVPALRVQKQRVPPQMVWLCSRGQSLRLGEGILQRDDRNCEV